MCACVCVYECVLGCECMCVSVCECVCVWGGGGVCVTLTASLLGLELMLRKNAFKVNIYLNLHKLRKSVHARHWTFCELVLDGNATIYSDTLTSQCINRAR